MAPDPETISAATRLRRRDDLASVEVEGETIIYDPVAEMLHHLDRIATIVWRELDGSTPLQELTSDLADVFETEQEVVATDVLRLARQLATDGLVHEEVGDA